MEVISMRGNTFVAVVLALTTVTAAHAVRARLDIDKTWLGPTDDLVAKVTIINDTQETVLVPKWQVPGQILEADIFAVTQDGHPAPYLGRLVKRPAPGPSDFVRLAPGRSIQGQTELSR